MRIVRFGVEIFGVFTNLTSPDLLGQGFVLLWGFNEAGKSTLLRFFRQLFFGYQKDAEGQGGTPAAGWADLDVAGKLVRWERRASGRQRRGEVRLLPAGDPAQLLGNVSADHFSNVFAVGLNELEELKSLEAVDLGARLYTAAGLGALALRLPKVEEGLDQELGTLIAPRSNKARINAVLSDLNDVIRSRQQLDGSATQYNELLARERELQERLEELQRREDELAGEQGRLERSLHAWPHWEKLLQARREMGLRANWPGFPADAEARLEEREKAVREAERAVEDSARACQELQAKMEKIQVEDELLDNENLWRRLEEERSRWRDAREKLTQVDAELRGAEERIQAELEALGDGWTEERVRDVNTSLVLQAEVEELRRQFDQLETSIHEHRRRVMSLEAGDEAANGPGAGKPALVGGQSPLRARYDALQQAAEALRHLHDAQAELARRHAALATWEEGVKRSQELAKVLEGTDSTGSGLSQGRAGRVVGTIAVAVAGSVVLALVGLPWPAAIVGALLISLLAAVLLGRQGSRPERESARPDDLKGRWAEVTRQQQEEGERLRRAAGEAETTVESQLAAVVRQLGDLFGQEQVVPPGPDDYRGSNSAWMRHWEERVAEELRRLERDLVLHEDRERQLREARQALAAAEEEFARLSARWAKVAGRVGVEPGLKPGTALQLIQRIQQLRQVIAGRDRLRQDRQRLEDELGRNVGLFQSAVGKAGLSGGESLVWQADDSSSPFDPRVEEACWTALPQWLARVASAREARAARQRLQELLEQARDAEKAARERFERARTQLLDLLAAGGTDDPEVFRQRAEQVRRFREAETEAKSAAASLGVLFGLVELDLENVFARVQAELSGASPVDLKLMAEQVAADRRGVQEERDRANGELATVRQQLANLAVSEERAAAQQRESELRTALREAVARAGVLCLARGMLAEVRRRYEEERQPEVLRRAGFYFEKMTGGRYRRVVVPLTSMAAGQDKQRLELWAERHDGQYLSPGQLSRGTAEQLYLAIRLALAEDYALRVNALPLLLDDVLVNFDPRRLGGALSGVAELARELQVFLFTCHPHVVAAATRTARAAGTGCRILMLTDGSSLVEANEQEIARVAANS